ncbi:PAS domain-containing protein [Paracraurococcus lichenis]|uniref:PAS domain-containing protein n=1 Tax=Paracraurococcus lichenis TaxID=3064888 RepID=A0ABT9ECJ1_9PROT|nr:PAS domain-containing protein [Paracraurococcus sp. LOR1-02]MDO9713928.1 PAS domain-containing protein [Paracraurococcus sp. LOR1-02]
MTAAATLAEKLHMSRTSITPSGRESPFGEDEIIVTKTDLQGRLTYANDVFLRVSKYRARDVLGRPHSLVRHPEMPRCVFELLWQTLRDGGEFFGYVVNLASDGDHYWVFAHATPSRDAHGNVVGYHSSRRPDPAQIARIKPVYDRLLRAEAAAPDRKTGQRRGADELHGFLRDSGTDYERFVFSL